MKKSVAALSLLASLFLSGLILPNVTTADDAIDAASASGGRFILNVQENCPTSPNSVGSGAMLKANARGTMLDVVAVNSAPSNFAILMYGTPSAPHPFFGGVSCQNWNHAVRVTAPVVMDDAGSYYWQDVEIVPQDGGDVLDLCVLYRDPAVNGGHWSGGNLSNSLLVTFAP